MAAGLLPVCPKCETQCAPDAGHCPGCGYEFATGIADAGPFSFAFPAVERAYRPSGKGTAAGYLLVLACGLAAAIAGGAALHGVDLLISALFASLERSFLGLLVVLAIYVIAGGGLGYLISRGVGYGALRGKIRNPATVGRLGLVCGLAGSAAYAATRAVALGGSAFDSGLDLLKVALYALGTVLLAWLCAGDAVQGTPFCEECGRFLPKREFRPIPISQENALLQSLSARRFEAIAALPIKPGGNYCAVTLWHCPRCQALGYVYAETTQTRLVREGGENKTKSETRLVFSSRLDKAEVERLLAAGLLARGA